MVDLGLVQHFLGMVVSRDVCMQKVYITQEGYIGRVLERFGMSDFKPVATPMDKDKPGEREEEEEACDKTLYQQLIGSLGWIAIGTRPDISFAISYIGRFGANPSQQYWVCAMRVLRYLAGTRYLRLGLGGNLPLQIPLNGFVDADFAGDTGTLKSTTGYILLMGSAVIQWHSKRVYYGDQHSRRRVYCMRNGDSGTHQVPSSSIRNHYIYIGIEHALQ